MHKKLSLIFLILLSFLLISCVVEDESSEPVDNTLYCSTLTIENAWPSNSTINGFSGGDITKVSVDSIEVPNSSIARSASKTIDLSGKTESVRVCLLFENYIDNSSNSVDVCSYKDFSCAATSSKFDDPFSCSSCGWKTGSISNCTGCFF